MWREPPEPITGFDAAPTSGVAITVPRVVGLPRSLFSVNTSKFGWFGGLKHSPRSCMLSRERVRDLGQSHRTVVGTLNHYFLSEELWADCLATHKLPALYTLGQSPAPPDLSIEELQRRWPPIWKNLDAWLIGPATFLAGKS
jgi:hypothetical protein